MRSRGRCWFCSRKPHPWIGTCTARVNCKLCTAQRVKDIFISYGREEGVREFVKQLKADLEANGVSV